MQITKEIWLPHCMCRLHIQHIKWAYKPNTFVHMCAKTQPNAINIFHFTAKHVHIWHICPANWAYMP